MSAQIQAERRVGEEPAGANITCQVDFERMATIYALTPAPVVAGALYSLLLAWGMRQDVSAAVLLPWLAARLALCSIRIWESRRFARDENRVRHLHQWRQRYLALMVLESLSWSLMGVMFVGAASNPVMAMLIFASVLCIAAVGVFTLVSHFGIAVVSIAVILLPFGLYESWRAAEATGFMLAALSIYAGVLVNEARRAERAWSEMARLRFEAAAVALERERAQRLAQDSSRAKSQFLANMSHEIRTPLNGMIGLTEGLLRTPLQAQQKRQLELSLTSAEHLLRLVNEVLDVSRIQAGGMSLESAPMDLRNVLATTAALFEAQAEAKGLRLQQRLAADLPARVMGDSLRLSQILANLVGNAVKFTREGEVVLSAELRPGAAAGHARLHLAVIDSGPGIAGELHSEVFRAFSQGDAATARQHGGSGLGLTISAELVRLMGSRLRLESALGQGSEFSFDLDLPVLEADPTPLTPTAANAEPTPLRGARVLLVEDNEVNALVASEMLRAHGAQVQHVDAGEKALALPAQPPWDLVLMDVQMPGLDGLQSTRLWREREARERLPRTPVLALTANALAEDREQCLAAGMDAVLIKPIRTHELVAAAKGHRRPVRAAMS